MAADFLTKPQQGALFYRMRDMLMGHTPMPHIEDPPVSSQSTTQERVGSKNIGVNERRTDGESPGGSTQETNPHGKPAGIRANQKTVTWADRVRGVHPVERETAP